MPESRSVSVKIKRLAHFKGELPRYETPHASGMDVRAQLMEPLRVEPRSRVLVPTGLQFEIPPGFEIQVRPRSGWAAREGLTVLNAPGTIDADFRGEVKVLLVNLGEHTVEIYDQDRIAQLVVAPVMRCEWLDSEGLASSERGAGGFGSTGRV